MASTLRVPTEFTAIDKFTQVVSKMAAGVASFSKTAQASISRVNNKLDSMIGLTSAVKGALAGLTVAALFAAAIKDIQAYDDALASFRTIVSDLSDKDFGRFEKAIGSVANQTKKSTIQVAQSFEKIAGLNAEFAKTADGISEVSREAIKLSKASGSDETENLVGIMNQFNIQAKEAARVSNVLAAGQAAGASTIAQSAEAYKNFGAVAKSSNITLEQSQALIQTLGKFTIFGAEAGTKLRGVTLQLQKAGLGYKSGQFQINDALADANRKMNKLSSAKQKDAYLTKLFGAENISAGKILLGNIETYKQFTTAVTGANAAQEQATIKSNTLSNKIEELKNSFTNLLTTNDNTKKGITLTKDVLGFLANNMDVVIGLVTALTVGYVALKVIQLAVTATTFASSVAMGVLGATTGAASIAIGQNTVAMAAYKTMALIVTGVTKAWTAAQWLINVALTANPIGIIIVAVAALIALVVVVIKKWDEWGAALSIFMGPLGLIISIIQSFRRNWEMVKKAFSTGGILGGLKAIGAVLIDAILMPIQQLLTWLAKIPGLSKLATAGADKIKELRQGLGVTMEGNNTITRVDSPQEANAKQAQENRFKGNMDINLNDPNNSVKDVNTSFNGGIPVNVTKTQGAF